MRYGICGCDAFVQLASWYGIEGSIGWLQRLLWHYQQEQGCILPWGVLEHRERFTQFFTFADDRHVELTELSKYWLLGKKRDGVVRPPKVVEDIGFSSWFSLYPRKIGKQAAYKSWIACKATRPSDEQMMVKLNRHMQSEQWTKDSGKFIPHPSTYLNQGRWEDETETNKIATVKYDGNEVL